MHIASGDPFLAERGAGRTDPRRALGAMGETLVAGWYEQHGYVVVERNWRRNEGEIDLIVSRNRTYVFCEVKTRSSEAFGTPAEAVSYAKRARLRHLAARWLSEEAPRPAREIRFDVAAVIVPSAGSVSIDVIEGAF